MVTQTKLAQGPNGSTPCAPPPPPPRRPNGTYPQQTNASPNKQRGVGSPRGMSKSAVVTLSLVTMATVVYASCHFEPSANVIIFIPPTLHLGAVKLFFNRHYDNLVITDQWSGKNTSQLRVIDLHDASPTDNPPCSADRRCPNAHIQNLADCDASTESCVCIRGYTLSNGICMDLDECNSGYHSCPATAICQNLMGSYVCQCGYGYYGQRRTCRVCSFGCPAGQYEASPCSNNGDRVCKDCTECKGSMYEARPCGGTTDRQCMHAAHPLLITGEETTPTFLEGLKVEGSDNIFMENLHATRNLATTYYVTDMTQAFDFYYIRQSTLQVNIGILDVHLIPEYEDVDHESDNSYMEANPNNSEDKMKFAKIVNKFCRHPIPDYYSITLEISRDRITSASPHMCNSKDPSVPDCPEGYNDGDLYLHRTLNEPCKQMGTFPEDLSAAANSIVCTQNTGLLRNIFNQSYTPEQPIPFPSKRCRTAKSRCTQCLTQKRCVVSDIFEQQCCQIDCYTLRDCKMAASPHCSNAPMECASGDAYRYTIQPVFQNIKNEFQCHIEHKKPTILYKMFYNIMIPERNFETPKVYKTIYAHDLQYQSHGDFIADYITVEHNSGLNLHDEFIIVGREIPSSKNINFTVHSMKEDEQFRKKRVTVHEISTNIHIASTQFRRPFDYSTSSWVQENGCEKDVNKFKSVQKHYNGDSQGVQVMLENVHHPFKFFLKSTDNPPYLTFNVPGNESILPWYFRDHGPVLYTNNSLVAELELTAGGRIWNIRIKGKMSGCPAYLGITINNRLDLEELFRYDTLIFCPTDFNLTFKVPNWGQDPDKTFDVHLEDAKKSYDIYLTHMTFEQTRVEKVIDPPHANVDGQSAWSSVVDLPLIFTLCLVPMLIVYVFLECTKKKMEYVNHNINVYHSANGGKNTDDYCIAARNLSQGQVAFIVLYTMARIIYTLLFTFTVFFSVLTLLLRSDFIQLSKMSEYHVEKNNETRQLAFDIARYGQDELLRQAKLVTSMQGACSNYIQELFDTMQYEMDNITANTHRLEMYGDHSSISFLMKENFARHLQKYLDRTKNYTGTYRGHFSVNIEPKMTEYKKYLRHISDNDWFQFPQLLYNKTRFPEKRPQVLKDSLLKGPLADFATYLDVEEVEDSQFWPLQFWQRYYNRYPYMPTLPSPSIDPGALSCDLETIEKITNISTNSPTHQLDSSKYFAPHLPGKSIRGPTFKDTHVDIDDEYKFLAPMDIVQSADYAFSVEDLVDSIDVKMLKVIFIVLDVIIVVYRCTRTYMTITSLCRGFEESTVCESDSSDDQDVAAKESELQNLRNQHKHSTLDDRTSEHTVLKEDKDIDPAIPDYSGTLESQRGMLQPKSNSSTMQSMVRNDISGKQQNESRKWKRKWRKADSCKLYCGKLLQSSMVPKLLIYFILLILLLLVLQLAHTLLTVDVISELEGFKVFLMGIDVQVNQTNWYLSEQAKHFNNVTMKIYENQMKSELLNLQSMLDFFNAEQKRLVHNYITEACAVKRDLLVNRPCDVNILPMRLQIPVLPCNFVPIQPQLFTGFKENLFNAQLGHDFQPFLTAAINVVYKFRYAILCVFAVMLIIHATGALVFHFLKRRHKFPVHHVYISTAPPSGLVRRAPSAKDYESESDDNESAGFKSYPTRVRMSPEKSYPQTETLLTDFKYSETKV